MVYMFLALPAVSSVRLELVIAPSLKDCGGQSQYPRQGLSRDFVHLLPQVRADGGVDSTEGEHEFRFRQTTPKQHILGLSILHQLELLEDQLHVVNPFASLTAAVSQFTSDLTRTYQLGDSVKV